MTCKQCGRPTWKGCGAHVEQVLGDVPKGQRCQCRTGTIAATPIEREATPTATRRTSWFRR